MVGTATPSAFEVSNGLWNECCLAFQFINGGVREALCGTPGHRGPLPAAQEAAWWRSIAWQSSLMRLTSPGDFQAVFAASRGLMEILVDCVLLQHEPDASARQRDWEDSAKLKHAQGIARFYNGRSAPREMQHAIAFAQREGARIDAARLARNWVTNNGRPRHPDRWTDRNLGDDSRAADRLENGLGLEEAYETRFRQMCWYVHGSGAVGVRSMGAENFPGLGGLMFRTCSRLAVQHARLLLRYAGIWDIPYRGATWTDHFEQLRRIQALTTHAAAFGPEASHDEDDDG